jgi:hypothetical protein
VGWFRYIHLALHGLRNGVFSMRCQWSATMGEAQAARLIADTGLEPAGLLNDFADFETQR